ncbi:MAG: phytanoyl-CoA dioxygenase family protein [Pseudomonadales bacterium]|jgi:ectoine hydroxylase-related dioxygenase (phytanoyl-CoA dioxygenase family)|nr:phytanoyl-CoA dioxygenase family protein [Pseudomonadales bacterium]
MPSLQTLPATADTEDILRVINADGAVILQNVLQADEIEQFRREMDPFMEATAAGQDDFSGQATTRTGALVARSAKAREMLLNTTVVSAAEAFLAPYCKRIQVHLTQIIRLKPGQGKQMIHRDRWAWGQYLQNVEPQFNTIWAISDFTAENGATQVVPGSTNWPDDRTATEAEICQAEMSAGSVLLYTGSVFHGGGENRANADRIGVNLTYTLGWLRQEENQYLSCPPEIAKSFSSELQDLLGYTMGQYALGYYTPPAAPGAQPECVTPAHAVREVAGDAMGGAALLAAGRQKT